MENIPKKVLGGLLLAGGIWLGYRMVSNSLKTYKAQSVASQADQSEEVRQAVSIRTALNPSGISWLVWADGTQDAFLSKLSREIRNWPGVLKAYQSLYQRDLIKDLQSELSSKELDAFFQGLVSGQINESNQTSSTAQGAYTRAGRLIVARQNVLVRTSPDASYQGNWWELREKNNIHRTARKGELIGYATGRQFFDAKNNVKFIEIGFEVSSQPSFTPYLDDAGKRFLLWVSASSLYTDQFDRAQEMLSRYPAATLGLESLLPLSGQLGVSPYLLATTNDFQLA